MRLRNTFAFEFPEREGRELEGKECGNGQRERSESRILRRKNSGFKDTDA